MLQVILLNQFEQLYLFMENTELSDNADGQAII